MTAAATSIGIAVALAASAAGPLPINIPVVGIELIPRARFFDLDHMRQPSMHSLLKAIVSGIVQLLSITGTQPNNLHPRTVTSVVSEGPQIVSITYPLLRRRQTEDAEVAAGAAEAVQVIQDAVDAAIVAVSQHSGREAGHVQLFHHLRRRRRTS
jgi:hypothetical protein